MSSELKPERQEPYSPAHKLLLGRLINEFDPQRITWRSERTASLAQRKKAIWDEITWRFNASSGRKNPATAAQLIKQGGKMRAAVR